MRNESMNLSKNEMMMVMHDQEQEIEKLKSQVAELQAKLDGYEIKVSESGNLAEAAAKVAVAQAEAGVLAEDADAAEAVEADSVEE